MENSETDVREAWNPRVSGVQFARRPFTRAASGAASEHDMEDREFVFAPFRLDPVSQQLWRGGELIPLRPKLFAVLRHLLEHAGRLVTRDELRAAAWPATVVSESVLRGAIRELRDVLGDDA